MARNRKGMTVRYCAKSGEHIQGSKKLDDMVLGGRWLEVMVMTMVMSVEVMGS